MKSAPLGTIADIKTGKLDVNAGTENGKYPFFTCAVTPYKIDEYAFDTEAVLIAGNGDLNVKYYQGKFNAYQRTYVVQNKDKSTLSMKYLYYFIETYMDCLRRDAIGGIIKYIKLGHLTNAEIPLPPLDDQKRIAHLLGKVEGLIAQRKQHLQQLEDLLKSVFLEMFGDPVRNEKGWATKPFGKLLKDIESGKSPKCEARIANTDEWGVLKLGAVTSCFFKEIENKALPQETPPRLVDEVKKGDLLFSRKNTYELVAACAYVFNTRPKLLLPDLIFRFVFNDGEEINPIYMWKLLTSDSQRRKVQSLAGGAAGSMPNISKTNLKTVLLPIPPIELQNQFATTVEKVEGIKFRYQQNLTELENLYGALSQKAFKGELDLSRITVPNELKNITASDSVNLQLDDLSVEVSVPDVAVTRAAPLPDKREAALREYFDSFLRSKKVGEKINVEQFCQLPWDTKHDSEEEDIFSSEDYDVIKKRLIQHIESNKIVQTHECKTEGAKTKSIVLKKAI